MKSLKLIPIQTKTSDRGSVTSLFLVFLYMVLVFSLSFPLHAVNPDPLIAIKASKIVTVSGQTIENGTILINSGKIEKVGSNLPIPPEYKIYEYKDGTVYPGLINAFTSVGLTSISSLDETNDSQESGMFNPQISASAGIYPWGNLVPIIRDFGTLGVLSAPTGGIIGGKAVLIIPDGWNPEDMIIKKEAALIIDLPEPSPQRMRRRNPDMPAPVDESENIKKKLHDFISRAYAYYLRSEQESVKSTHGEDFDMKLDGMKAIWKDQLPVMIIARKEASIKYALELAKEFKFKLILVNAYEGEKVLKEIKEAGVPVVLDSMYTANAEWTDGADKVLRLPGLLVRQGIRFAFSTYAASGAFDLPIQAGRAVAYGLSQEEALKGLTLYPAQFLGLNSMGSIEEGKMAHLVVTNGNILETSTVVIDIFVKGKRVIDKNFFRKEYERAKDKVSGEYR